MTLEVEYLELMTQGFVLNRFTGKDAHGNKQYGSDESFTARYESRFDQRGRSGQTRTATQDQAAIEVGTVISDVLSIMPYDRITTPTGKSLDVMSVLTEYDEFGPHHEVSQVQEAQP